MNELCKQNDFLLLNAALLFILHNTIDKIVEEICKSGKKLLSRSDMEIVYPLELNQ